MPTPSALPAALVRGAVFFGLWLVLTGAEPFGLPFGLIAAFGATTTSLRLLPPGGSRIAPGACRASRLSCCGKVSAPVGMSPCAPLPSRRASLLA